MRFSTYIMFQADSPEDALHKVSRWKLSKGAVVQGISTLPEMVPYEGFPHPVDDEGNVVPPGEPPLEPGDGPVLGPPDPPDPEGEEDEE